MRCLHPLAVAAGGWLLHPLARAQDGAGGVQVLDESLVAEFQHLWQMVVIDQQSRNVPQGEAPPVRRACQFGISTSTIDLARFMLAYAWPPIEELELLDIAHEDDSPDMLSMARQLESEFGSQRVRRHGSGLWQRPALPANAGGIEEICDLVLFSKASTRFSVDRILPRVGSHVVAVWVSDSCIHETSEVASPECNFLNTFWEKTYLMMRGYCSPRICTSRVLKSILQDPNTLPLDCDRIATEDGSNASISEFGQDWFALRNFIRPEPGSPGRYVDVGASLPFDYSNTVMLDRCLGWEGVCIEPNPHLGILLEAYRSCQVFKNCVDQESMPHRPFADRSGKIEFHQECLPLGDILTRAGLRGKRIDIMSIDVEHQELSVLRSLRLEDFDIRVMVIEVTRGARWLEVDSELLPKGYAKVAVLGRDVVYVKLEELRSKQMADWSLFLRQLRQPEALLPEGWAAFHQRVLDEEMEEEMRRERKAFYAGLRPDARAQSSDL
eukprot:TRINITY_DN27685_c0_g1_i1.p1 TRINITY_DN27685_c0_g1~~TRINITY_DN27685_c0_g1_i1.p1  ORF type:complete len:497 (+),score=90.98 TRINITY_DN27685_c0_g1_i1:41-1531(+)